MHDHKIIRGGAVLEDAHHALLLMHGRGGSPYDMLELAQRFCDPDWHLAAPMATNATWYPYSFLAPRERNEPWLTSAVEVVHTAVEELHKRLPYDHIHLMGFSQGACLTTEAAAQAARHFGGIYAFTGGLIGDRIDTSFYRGHFDGTPVYLSNSEDDPHVPLTRSKETLRLLEEMGARVTLDVFPGRPHTINAHEIERVQEMIQAGVGRH